MIENEQYLPKSGILPQYAHLRGIEENMPVIRKILGISAHGQMPDNFIGRAMQRFIEENSKKALRESTTNNHSIIE